MGHNYRWFLRDKNWSLAIMSLIIIIIIIIIIIWKK